MASSSVGRRSRCVDRRNRRRRERCSDRQRGWRWRGNRGCGVHRQEGHPCTGGDKADFSTGSVGHGFPEELINPTTRTGRNGLRRFFPERMRMPRRSGPPFHTETFSKPGNEARGVTCSLWAGDVRGKPVRQLCPSRAFGPHEPARPGQSLSFCSTFGRILQVDVRPCHWSPRGSI